MEADNEVETNTKGISVKFQNDDNVDQILDVTSKARSDRVQRRNERKMNLVHGRVFVHHKNNKKDLMANKPIMQVMLE